MAVNDDELFCSHEVGCRIRILSLEMVNFSTLKKARRDLMHAVIPLVPTGLSLFLPVTKTMDLLRCEVFGRRSTSGFLNLADYMYVSLQDSDKPHTASWVSCWC